MQNAGTGKGGPNPPSVPDTRKRRPADRGNTGQHGAGKFIPALSHHLGHRYW